MESSKTKSLLCRKKRALRVRKHIKGTSEKPRLSVVKTNKHIYAQLIDDVNHVTLAAASTVSKELRGTDHAKKSKAAAQAIGTLIAQTAEKLGIKQAIFDRGPFKYHGILKELAEVVRSTGIVI